MMRIRRKAKSGGKRGRGARFEARQRAATGAEDAAEAPPPAEPLRALLSQISTEDLEPEEREAIARLEALVLERSPGDPEVIAMLSFLLDRAKAHGGRALGLLDALHSAEGTTPLVDPRTRRLFTPEDD
jgi:hypothetical protein